MTAALLFFNALLDAGLVAVLLCAAWQRRENRLLALAATIDATCMTLAGILLSHGFAVTDALCLRCWLFGRVWVAYPVLAFTYAFPQGEQPPRWVRWLGLGGAPLFTASVLHPATALWAGSWYFRLAFFLPFFIAVLLVARRNWRAASRRAGVGGATVVFATFVVRFATELTTCVVIAPLVPRAVPAAFTLDVVVAVCAYVLLAYTVLKHRLFRVRGLIAEAFLYGGLCVVCLGLSAGGLELVARHVHGLALRLLAFSLLTLLALGAHLALVRYAPLLETTILAPFDARRHLLRAALQRVGGDATSAADAATACEVTRAAIASLCGGTVTLWRLESKNDRFSPELEGPVLPDELADYLRRSPGAAVHLRSSDSFELAAALARIGADALVAVRAQGSPLCAFAIRSDFIEQDLLDTISVLADNFGSKLAHEAMREYASDLQSQLDVSRRLTTLGAFVAAIAHDIRTPLTSAKLNLDLIRASANLNDDMQECADLASAELRRLNDSVSTMLDYVKPLRLCVVELDLKHLLDECARVLEPLLDSRNVRLVCKLAESASKAAIRADATRLKQVLLNLLENAADASRPGQEIRATLGSAGATWVTITIEDQGQGIAASDLNRIFEPFFTTREEGVGLGLAIVKKLVRAHGGDVSVESLVGAGSKFVVRLPTQRADEVAFPFGVASAELDRLAARMLSPAT